MEQMTQLRKMGDLSQMAAMFPGQMGKQMAGAQIDDRMLNRQEAVILSQKDRTRFGKQVVTLANEKRKDGRLTLSGRPGASRGDWSSATGTWRLTAPLKPWCASSGGELDREISKLLFGE